MNALFIRENRFLALKWDDIHRYLPEDKRRQLYSYVETIAVRRLAEGKKEHQYVVVADDWPEYEVVWKMVEDRCNGVPSEIEQLRAENRDLLMRNHVSHELFQTGDIGCPEQALDRNGEVVLGVCKNCGRVESELAEPCDNRTLTNLLRAENAKLKAQRDFLIEIMHLVSEALIVGSRTDLDLADQLTSAINNVKEEA